jgi:pimeloyl-ACP methyl ester carboxylesterase
MLGRLLLIPFIAQRDDKKFNPSRGRGATVAGADGARLYVESIGPLDAPVLILTHGWGLDSTIWHYARLDLGDRFRLMVWDLPGMGLSRPAPHNGVSLQAFAANLDLIIGMAGQRKVFLVGHSIGGMAIQALARERPEAFDTVAGVVLLNTTNTNPLKTMILAPLACALRWPVWEPALWLTIALQPLAWLSAWQSYFSGAAHLANRIAFGSGVTRSELGHTTLLTTRNSPAHQARGNLAMLRWDAKGALAKSGVPVLIVGGANDIVTTPKASEGIARDTPHSRLEIIAGANHMSILERAAAYHEVIRDFVDSIQRVRGQSGPSIFEVQSTPFGHPLRAGNSETSSTNKVADPHPSTEEHYDRIKHPGGADTPQKGSGTQPIDPRRQGTPAAEKHRKPVARLLSRSDFARDVGRPASRVSEFNGKDFVLESRGNPAIGAFTRSFRTPLKAVEDALAGVQFPVRFLRSCEVGISCFPEARPSGASGSIAAAPHPFAVSRQSPCCRFSLHMAMCRPARAGMCSQPELVSSLFVALSADSGKCRELFIKRSSPIKRRPGWLAEFLSQASGRVRSVGRGGTRGAPRGGGKYSGDSCEERVHSRRRSSNPKHTFGRRLCGPHFSA